ncbi:MAG: aspartate kinase [Clostridiales bacterium]|nr:aspartate kinase [Clostridiales bacterium]
MYLKICKFGGTSMAEKSSILKVKDIVRGDLSRRFVVVSAPGKRFSGDIKITDQLYSCFEQKQKTGSCKQVFEKIRQRYIEIVRELKVDIEIESYLDQVEREIDQSITPDFAASRGEYLCALIMSKVIGYEFVDAAEIIKFDAQGIFDAGKTYEAVKGRLSIEKGAIIPGFYGALPDGTIKTFTRGGSDFTGAIIAKGVMADLYENWTDVDGFMTADPRVVDNPRHIEVLSFEELRELSYMGASVLHPESTFPLNDTKIPINIKNTFNPSDKGTLILKNIDGYNQPIVTGIAGKAGFTSIFIRKAMMNSEIGFCRRVLSVLEEHWVSLEHMPTGIDSMCLIIPDDSLSCGKEFALMEAIRKEVNPDHIYISKSLSLIAVVGHGMTNQIGTSAKVFTALANANINVKMIDQGSSEMNIIIGVETSDANRAIQAIYNAYFG